MIERGSGIKIVVSTDAIIRDGTGFSFENLSTQINDMRPWPLMSMIDM